MIEVTAERYRQLIEAEIMLNALYAGGVDNWENYDHAVKTAKDNMKTTLEKDEHGRVVIKQGGKVIGRQG